VEDSLNLVNRGGNGGDGGDGGDGGNVTVLEGCSNVACAAVDITTVKAAVTKAGVSVVILAMGIDDTVEGEGHDRMDIRLPGKQSALIQAVLDAASTSTRVVLLLFNGGLVAVDAFKGNPRLAIVECWCVNEGEERGEKRGGEEGDTGKRIGRKKKDRDEQYEYPIVRVVYKYVFN
jgi:hypothetical protein